MVTLIAPTARLTWQVPRAMPGVRLSMLRVIPVTPAAAGSAARQLGRRLVLFLGLITDG
jgi:hypothetical protein